MITMNEELFWESPQSLQAYTSRLSNESFESGVSKLFCPRATQAETEHVEGRTPYAM